MGKIENDIYISSNGEPSHRGVFELNGNIYYAGKDGVLIKNQRKIIHHGMSNGLLHHGSYYFDEKGICDVNSYKSEKHKHHKKHKKIKKNINEKQTAFIVLLCVSILVVLLFIFSSVFSVFEKEYHSTSTEDTSIYDTSIQIELPNFENDVYLCSPTMEKYYKGECALEEVVESGSVAYQPLIFSYTITNADTGFMLISENEDYSNSMRLPIDVNQNTVVVNNLKTDMKYYYLITVESTNGESKSVGGTFITADTNRFISFDGVYNTRDIGGYNTLYGKKIKQGLLIRGTEIDGLVESKYYLINVDDTKNFQFVCDFDLRNSSIFNTNYISRLGKEVLHKFYNSPMYGGIFAVGNEALLKAIFTDLADENNYPMYLHCTYGADRTGTIVLLLQGLLGVSEEDMRTEYALTGFFNKSYVSGDYINSIFAGLEGCKGDTINEKIENYMIDTVGLTSEQIQSIRSIFLE